jgi:hypothetical protein
MSIFKKLFGGSTDDVTLGEAINRFSSEIRRTPFSRIDPDVLIAAGVVLQVQASPDRTFDDLIAGCNLQFGEAAVEHAKDISKICLALSQGTASDIERSVLRPIGELIWSDGGTLAMAYALCLARVRTRLPLPSALRQLFFVSTAWNGIGDDDDKWKESFVNTLFCETVRTLAEPPGIPVLEALEAQISPVNSEQKKILVLLHQASKPFHQ